MQPHYLENLLQLQYLLLASNKLQAARYSAPVAAQRLNSYIPGSVTPATRPTMFDVNHMSLSPGGFQHGYTAARFPRLVLSRIMIALDLILVFGKATVAAANC